MMAAYVSRHFKLDGKKVALTLVESAEVPPTGVGEATIHTMRGFLEEAGISEQKFIDECQGTFKHGIEFAGWSEKGGSFFHPFETPPVVFQDPLALNYLSEGRDSGPMSKYENWAGIQSRLAKRGVSPRTKADRQYTGIVPYGYHLDANAFAHFLKKIAVKRGVKHIISHVEDVEIAANRIERLHLKDGQKIEADVWVDCTGFAARLIGPMGGTFISSADHLLVNAAVTCQVKKEHVQKRPFTTATARNAGWTFDIDLQTRGGRGYVYSKDHITPDQAFAEFSAAYPGQVDEDRARHFDLRVGRMNSSWIGNCCAVGLSAGFLEPMESTGLYFVEYTARVFVEALQALDDTNMDQQAKWFSDIYSGLFDEISAFIEMHYKMSDRRDTPFWQDATSAKQSDLLERYMSLWQSRLSSQFDFSANSFFGPESWQAILFGLGWKPQKSHRLGAIDKKTSIANFKELHSQADRITMQNPPVTEYFGI
jgi:tryptophan halogenase